jgi:predicted nucleic acid-binding protein
MLAGECSANLSADGTPIEIEDVMIAAIARQRNEPILTGNPTHFERIDHIEVETY